jgi:hypothetical protein
LLDGAACGRAPGGLTPGAGATTVGAVDDVAVLVWVAPLFAFPSGCFGGDVVDCPLAGWAAFSS